MMQQTLSLSHSLSPVHVFVFLRMHRVRRTPSHIIHALRPPPLLSFMHMRIACIHTRARARTHTHTHTHAHTHTHTHTHAHARAHTHTRTRTLRADKQINLFPPPPSFLLYPVSQSVLHHMHIQCTVQTSFLLRLFPSLLVLELVYLRKTRSGEGNCHPPQIRRKS